MLYSRQLLVMLIGCKDIYLFTAYAHLENLVKSFPDCFLRLISRKYAKEQRPKMIRILPYPKQFKNAKKAFPVAIGKAYIISFATLREILKT
jgi:hypothetical protein